MQIRNRMARGPAVAALAISLTFVWSGCKRHKAPVRTVEEAPALASVVAMADPHAATQLLTGFYGVESNAWRWTAGKFSVLLRPPRGAEQKGATLQFKFTLPEAALAKLKPLTVSAYVNGAPLAPETYKAAGDYTYTRPVPANLLPGESVRVDFSLDKTFQPSGADHRELGLVAAMIGLQ